MEQIQRLAWEHCGIVREAGSLKAAVKTLEDCCATHSALSPEHAVARNMHQVALLIAQCALAREESRGAHFRSDFPEKSAAFEKHTVISAQDGIRFV